MVGTEAGTQALSDCQQSKPWGVSKYLIAWRVKLPRLIHDHTIDLRLWTYCQKLPDDNRHEQSCSCSNSRKEAITIDVMRVVRGRGPLRGPGTFASGEGEKSTCFCSWCTSHASQIN